MSAPDEERLRRWRLVLGGGEADGVEVPLDAPALARDACLEALYDADRTGGLGASSPELTRWLGELRGLFPVSAIQVLQQDAVQRLKLTRVLLEPELLEAVEPDVELVAALLSLRGSMPARAREAVRGVVSRVVDELRARLAPRLRARLSGRLDRGARTARPRHADIDWPRTVRRNLHTWQPERRVLVPERLVGHPRRRAALGELILLVDQSGSMAASFVHAGVLACAMAGLPSFRTRLAAFDTEVADLSEHLDDPVELLLSGRLGGGTDLSRALSWARACVERPSNTLVVLISDLFDGGDAERSVEHLARMKEDGVTVVVLLALSDRGAPAHDARVAARVAALDIPCFACTPDRFPELMAAALSGRDLQLWAAAEGLARPRAEGG